MFVKMMADAGYNLRDDLEGSCQTSRANYVGGSTLPAIRGEHSTR
jgi:hypothetical protein